ncbi:MAG: nitrate reductase [Anaerolineae bacterium]|nr:nitrate reductase [Anaerolineae bacterium]
MAQTEHPNLLRMLRVLIIGLVVVIVVLGFVLVIEAVVQSRLTHSMEQVDALANSTDTCVTCHRETTPGIVEQYSRSTMAAAEVTCRNCHEVEQDYPGAVSHEDTYVLNSPTPARCEICHTQEVTQFYQSRHALPAYVAMTGTDVLDEQHLAMYQTISEVEFGPEQTRNALYDIEGLAITRFACESCHNIGKPQGDGSAGQCQKCHLRHEFTLEQARKPETCNACHIGPDHPQWEIYQESPHGIAYATSGESWNWEADAGTLTVNDFPAPTCATCHFSGFGTASTTHDVGDRLTWYLFAPTSTRRNDWEDNLAQMQGVCQTCHNQTFIDTFYADADKGTEAINALVAQSNDIKGSLSEAGLLTDPPFDQSFDFVHFEHWHHWGRTAKFGMWMQGPDYTQWHGVYEMLSDLTEMHEIAEQMLDEAEAEAAK